MHFLPALSNPVCTPRKAPTERQMFASLSSSRVRVVHRCTPVVPPSYRAGYVALLRCPMLAAGAASWSLGGECGHVEVAHYASGGLFELIRLGCVHVFKEVTLFGASSVGFEQRHGCSSCGTYVGIRCCRASIGGKSCHAGLLYIPLSSGGILSGAFAAPCRFTVCRQCAYLLLV